jgi:hypothetical protein
MPEHNTGTMGGKINICFIFSFEFFFIIEKER